MNVGTATRKGEAMKAMKKLFMLLVLCLFVLPACDKEAEATAEAEVTESTGATAEAEESEATVLSAQSGESAEAAQEQPASDPPKNEPADFLQFRWGMTKDEVVEVLDTLDYSESAGEIAIDTTWLGIDVRRFFHFDDAKGLVTVGHSIKEDYEEGRARFEACPRMGPLHEDPASVET
jgi:hypothetical protein